ncbi:hypothetical protein KAU37_07410 [Candidatus Bipolaricaulota bacterium]|nr:hypothetical protein [Candidatus Bipolaricaulota bacterium]
MSSKAVVGACVGIAIVVPLVLGLKGRVARALVIIGAPILTLAIALPLGITPMDNPLAFILMFGGTALSLGIAVRIWKWNARRRLLVEEQSTSSEPTGIFYEQKRNEESFPQLSSRESAKLEEAVNGSGNSALATRKSTSTGKIVRTFGGFILLVGVFLFFGMSFLGSAWEMAKMLWFQVPWVAIPILAYPSFDILPMITAGIYSAPFFAVAYILNWVSRRRSSVGSSVAAAIISMYAISALIAGLISFFRSP